MHIILLLKMQNYPVLIRKIYWYIYMVIIDSVDVKQRIMCGKNYEIFITIAFVFANSSPSALTYATTKNYRKSCFRT